MVSLPPFVYHDFSVRVNGVEPFLFSNTYYRLSAFQEKSGNIRRR